MLVQSDIASIRNEGMPTLMLPISCYVSYADSPSVNTFAHQLIAAGENGAVAIYGAAMLNNYHKGGILSKKVIYNILQGETLGEAVLNAKQSVGASFKETNLDAALIGDVTLRVR